MQTYSHNFTQEQNMKMKLSPKWSTEIFWLCEMHVQSAFLRFKFWLDIATNSLLSTTTEPIVGSSC